ncbi:MAG: hypothetical protein ACFE9D_08460 [Promethearchaeota archaeon]
MIHRVIWLKIAFLAGAIMDAITLIPLLFPLVATIIWGFTNITGEYLFAMWFGAALMLGWTLLLVWAYQKPLERRFVAVLTIFVVIGLMSANVAGFTFQILGLMQFATTLAIQCVILALFVIGWIITRNFNNI